MASSWRGRPGSGLVLASFLMLQVVGCGARETAAPEAVRPAPAASSPAPSAAPSPAPAPSPSPSSAPPAASRSAEGLAASSRGRQDPEQAFRAALKAGIDEVISGEPASAAEQLLKARALRPEDPEVNFWLFRAYRDTEPPSKSARAYPYARKVDLLSPETPMGRQAREYMDRARSGGGPGAPSGGGDDVGREASSSGEPVLVAPMAPADPAYLEDARAALDALRALDSVVSVGVNFRDYPRRVQDARIQVDRFLARNPEDQVRGLRDAMKTALDAYEDALDLWRVKFEDDDVSDFVPVRHPTVARLLRSYPKLKAEVLTLRARDESSLFVDSGLSVLWQHASRQVKAMDKALAR